MTDREKLLNALNEAVFELDATGKVVFATAALEGWTGKNGSYVFAAVLEKEFRKRFEQAFNRIIEGKTMSTRVELTMSHHKELVPVELTLNTIAGEAGKVAGVVCWLHDQTLARALEAAANVQGAHLFDLVENVTHACVIESEQGTVEMVNTAFCDLFELKVAAQSLVGTPCTSLFDAAANQVEKRMAPVYFALDSEESAELEFPLANGQMIIQQTRPVLGEHGIAGRLHLFHPRAGAQQTEEKTISASNAAQLQLIEQIAHELAATVESASSAISRAEQLELPDAVIERFRRVEQSAATAFSSIAGLVDFSRMDTARIILDPQKFSLRESVAQMLEDLLDSAEQRQVSLSLKIEQDVVDKLAGDRGYLLKVLQNLLECGMAAHPPGGEASLAIAPEYSTSQITHLSFTVQHSPPDGERHLVFTPTSMMQLAMAKQIVKAMGGKLDVSENKLGTAYQFTLEFNWRNVKKIADRPAYITLTGMPVLVVSSNIEERKVLTDLLRTWRMQTREADNGSMAMHLLTRMQREKNLIPLVIISDQISVQDSFLLAFRVKHHPLLSKTVVMMLAKTGKPGDAIACRENGISAYLRQPIVDYHLNEAIAMLMGVIDRGDVTDDLITRHSLRESSAGNVLIIDAQRDQYVAAAKIMRRNDYRVVTVETAQEAYESLKQDIFDLIIVDPATPGFARNKSIPGLLRNHIQKNAESIPILLACAEIPGSRTEYTGHIARPYEKEGLIAEVKRVHQ